MNIISLTLVHDYVLRCPFCGGDDIELKNTHTASYWIECKCGAEMHGRPFPGHGLKSHEKAKASAIEKWNDREAE